MRLVTLLFVTLLLVGCEGNKPSKQDLEDLLIQQESRFAAVSTLIERYRREHGDYPSSLQTVGDGARSAAILPTRGFESINADSAVYEVARDRSFFRLTYAVGDKEDYELHASYSYLSFEDTWKLDQHIYTFPHIEAKHFGAQYQQGRSAKSLELAIASILDAAKGNRAYPCLNLWPEWIEEALGKGEPQYRKAPLLPVDQATLYASKDNRVIYAIAIDQKKFSNRDKPLRFVVGVYEWRRGSRSWALVQHCDSPP